MRSTENGFISQPLLSVMNIFDLELILTSVMQKHVSFIVSEMVIDIKYYSVISKQNMIAVMNCKKKVFICHGYYLIAYRYQHL